jgi:gamma-glutamyltranspeptidase/glutathione hydrolase
MANTRAFRFGRVTPFLFLCAFSCAAPKSENLASIDGRKPVLALEQSPESRGISEGFGKEWIASTQGRVATDAVDRVYREGGNIIDAAVAASFAISVERPHSTGLGGGGFLLYREAKTGKIYAADFRERAPKRAHEKMYLDYKEEIIPNRSLVGVRAAGVPGLVRGLAEIHRRFGKAKWEKLLAPAIELAEQGLEVYPDLADALEGEKATLALFKTTRKIFLKTDGAPYRLGEVIVQKDLARTLRTIARTKDREFYAGSIAREILGATRGWIDANDLRRYRVKWREPVRAKFHAYEVVSMPPPSSGGTHLIEILNLLETYPLADWGVHSPDAIHFSALAMQQAFLDRARYMGDPEFTKVPVKTLISKEYAAEVRRAFRATSVDPAETLVNERPVLPEHSETTHFSIMDREGNVVVSTQTINGWFGSGLVAGKTGIVLNNEMDDFSAKPGASNLFGAIGSKANSVQAGKTPLSSMSPTIVLENGSPRLAVGAPGGTRIITCVAQTILNALVYDLPLYESVASVRIHQQWKPDVLRIEAPGVARTTEEELARRGWKIEKGKPGCAVMVVAREGDVLHGVSEPRDHGKAMGR